MSSAIPHITRRGNNGRTSRSATPQIDLRVWRGINPGKIRQRRPKPGRAGHGRKGSRRWSHRNCCAGRGADVGTKLNNFITQTATFPLIVLTQISQLVNETSKKSIV